MHRRQNGGIRFFLRISRKCAHLFLRISRKCAHLFLRISRKCAHMKVMFCNWLK